MARPSVRRSLGTVYVARQGPTVQQLFDDGGEWRPLDLDAALRVEAREVDRAGEVRRSGVVRGHAPISHRKRAVPMAQRHVVRAGGGDLLVADQPGTVVVVRAGYPVTVRRDHVALRAARARVA